MKHFCSKINLIIKVLQKITFLHDMKDSSKATNEELRDIILLSKMYSIN